MSYTVAKDERPGPLAILLRGMLTLLIGSALALLLLTLYAKSLLPKDVPRSVVLEPLVTADGARGSVITRSGLAVYADRQGTAQARLRLPETYFRYPFLEISLSERSAGSTLGIHAVVPDAPARLLQTIEAPLSGNTVLFLFGNPAWQSGAKELVLAFSVEPGSRVVVESLRLQQLSPGMALSHLVWAFSQTGAWSNSSPNFFLAAPSTPFFLRPVFAAGCVLLLGAGGVLLLSRMTRRVSAVGPGVLAALLLLWLVLDLHWQRELLANAMHSRELYWHKTDQQKQLAGPERELVRIAAEVKQALAGAQDPRIFVSSNLEFLGMRMAYYLLPHNVLWERGEPLRGPAHVRSGDYLVLLQPSEMRFRPEDGVLVYPDNRELAVTPLISGAGMLLLRVTE